MTVGADKAYDTAEFVRTCKAFGAEAHAARNTAGRRSNIGEEMAASEGYRASQVHRKRIEEVFGWGEDGGALLENPASRPGAGGLAVHPGAGSLRPDPTAEAAEGRSMTAGARCRATVGRSIKPAPARLPACPREDAVMGLGAIRHGCGLWR